MIKLPIGKWLSIYVLIIGLLNIVVSLEVVGFFSAPHVYIPFIISLAVLAIGYLFIRDIEINFRYSKFNSFIYHISILSFLLLVGLYTYQQPESLINFRTSNQHSIGFLWMPLNFIIIISPLGNVNKSLKFTFLMFIGVILSGSRLNLLLYILINMTVYEFTIYKMKTYIILLLTVIISSMLAVFRDGNKTIEIDKVLFFTTELVSRNVALLNGILIQGKDCYNDLVIENPLAILIPRFFYEDKPLVFNVRAFICYYDKDMIPSKSSGFFTAEIFSTVGNFLGGGVLTLFSIIFISTLAFMFNRLDSRLRVLIFPILIVGAFGPLDGIYSSSSQIFFIVFALFLLNILIRRQHVSLYSS
jgi:hypothetical protein